MAAVETGAACVDGRGGRVMKRILIVLLLVALLLCGCGKKETEEPEETEGRFSIEYHQPLGVTGGVRIIRDTETGKAYLFAQSGYAGGLTILDEGK